MLDVVDDEDFLSDVADYGERDPADHCCQSAVRGSKASSRAGSFTRRSRGIVSVVAPATSKARREPRLLEGSVGRRGPSPADWHAAGRSWRIDCRGAGWRFPPPGCWPACSPVWSA